MKGNINSKAFINQHCVKSSHESAKKAKHELLHTWHDKAENRTKHSGKMCAICDTHVFHLKDKLMCVRSFECKAIEKSPLNFSKQQWDQRLNSRAKAMLKKQCKPNFSQQFDKSKHNLHWMKKLEKFME